MKTDKPCRDNYRGFFEQCFAQLLKHIFGYDGSSWLDQAAQASCPSSSAHAYRCMNMLQIRSLSNQQEMQKLLLAQLSVPRPKHVIALCLICSSVRRLNMQLVQGMPEADAQALEGLLSPQGLLFKAMLSADADGLINFMFPLERLPIRTQLLLRSAPGRSYPCQAATGTAHRTLSTLKTYRQMQSCLHCWRTIA